MYMLVLVSVDIVENFYNFHFYRIIARLWQCLQNYTVIDFVFLLALYFLFVVNTCMLKIYCKYVVLMGNLAS